MAIQVTTGFVCLRSTGLALTAIAMLLAVGCGADYAAAFRNVKSLTISYRIDEIRNGQKELVKRTIPITDSKKIEEILSSVQVTGGREGVGVPLIDFCVVTLEYDDETKRDFKFIGGPRLQEIKQGGGLIFLKDDKFYEKVCEIISKKEGRKIDPIGDHFRN